ncbi:V-type proton ATPase subunit C 1-B [Esox lucius]|uniref:V-type proton ATPase subunit C 1-B n=1 Tax=Esox lucius TaxID=8010 RepID=UPI000577709C|nr:V-type proton ATPase subunit C 1-B [Esox lucius]
MTDFWLISVPQDRASSLSLEKLKHTVSKTNLASSFKFSIPELKVGTLDVLLGVSDDLSKLDTQAESVLQRAAKCMAEVIEQSDDKVVGNAQANGVDLVSYVTKFQWDRAKYSTALPLKNLADIIAKQVSQVETEMRSRSAAYNHIKSSLKGFEVKTEGCLQTRMLTDIVKREDLVDSEYLTTLLVVVSKASYAQWENTYESLSEFVVPRSSRKVFEEKEGAIFTVTLFKKAVSDFTANAKKNRFTIREYSFDQNECQKQEMRRLSVDKKEQYGTFVRWLKVNFREVFVAWIHLKVLGVFVESVLRYGLPVSFQTLLLQPDKKHGKKLREQLSSLFGHLDPTAPAIPSKMPDVDLDMPGVSTVAPQDYYSYICFQISVKLFDPN